jgi:hypothetical protein
MMEVLYPVPCLNASPLSCIIGPVILHFPDLLIVPDMSVEDCDEKRGVAKALFVGRFTLAT